MPWAITSTPSANPRNDSNYARHRKYDNLSEIIDGANDYLSQSFINASESTRRLTYLLYLELTRSGGAVIDQNKFLKQSGCRKQGDNNFFPLLSALLEDVCNVMRNGRTDLDSALSRVNPNTTVNYMSMRVYGFLCIRTWANKVQILFYRGKTSAGKDATHGYQWEMEYQ